MSEAGGAATLVVDDDGPGVPADRRGEIFERFARADDARAVGTGGTGLGLAIIRDVVERHRGTVAVDGSYRSGARFVVTLPAADVAAASGGADALTRVEPRR
ncbi:MAG: ATP-binding protein [Actinomycetota bacterium]|nr:ATP-binding protein [Actinomycetota bacterium]